MDIVKTISGLISDVDNNDIDSLKELYMELVHLKSELKEEFFLNGVSQRSELSFLEGYEIKVYESDYVDKPQLLLPKGLVKKDCG